MNRSIAGAAVAAALLLTASPVMAARPVATTTLAVSPDPVPAQSTFAVNGCGYPENVGLKMILEAPGVLAFWGGMTDATGCIVNTVGWATNPGIATLSAYSYESRSKKPLGQTTFTISP